MPKKTPLRENTKKRAEPLKQIKQGTKQHKGYTSPNGLPRSYKNKPLPHIETNPRFR
jgi:hypothetical protein